MLIDTGYVNANSYMGGGGEYSLSATGWQRIEEITSRRADTSQAFVAMWFSSEMNKAYE